MVIYKAERLKFNYFKNIINTQKNMLYFEKYLLWLLFINFMVKLGFA